MADVELAEERLSNRSQHQPALKSQPDQGAPERKAGHEGSGPVYRVQHPDELGVRPVLSILLADYAVLRIAFGDQRTDRPLGTFVRVGDGIKAPRAALVGHAMVAAEQRQDRVRCGAVQFHDEGVERFQAFHFEGGHRFALARPQAKWKPVRRLSGRQVQAPSITIHCLGLGRAVVGAAVR